MTDSRRNLLGFITIMLLLLVACAMVAGIFWAIAQGGPVWQP